MDVRSKARTNEIPCKPNGVTQRALDERFIRRTNCAVRFWLLTNGPSPFCFYLSNAKPGHTTGGSGQGGARRGGEAGRGGAGRDAVGSVRPGEHPTLLHPRAWKTIVLDNFSEAWPKETLRKPDWGTQRAIDERFIREATSALHSWPWLLNNAPTSHYRRKLVPCRSFFRK